MKLAPVTARFVRDRPKLKVVQVGITTEQLGICVRKGNAMLRAAIDRAQAELAAGGTLAALVAEWLGAGARPPGRCFLLFARAEISFDRRSSLRISRTEDNAETNPDICP